MQGRNNPKSPDETRLAQAAAALRAAVDRNASAKFVRTDRAETDPMSSSRLLKWDEQGVFIEPFEMMGKRVRLNTGHRVSVFVAIEQKVIGFEATVIGPCEPVRLNDETNVEAVRLGPPSNLDFSDRRNSFRTNLATVEEEIHVYLWFLDRYAPEGTADDDEACVRTMMGAIGAVTDSTMMFTAVELARSMPQPPSLAKQAPDPMDFEAQEGVSWCSVIDAVTASPPHARALLVDVTPNSLGLTMFGIESTALHIPERLVARVMLPGATVEVAGSIRRTTELPRSRARVGVRMIHPDPSQLHHPARRALEKLCMDIQRAELQRRASRAS